MNLREVKVIIVNLYFPTAFVLRVCLALVAIATGEGRVISPGSYI